MAGFWTTGGYFAERFSNSGLFFNQNKPVTRGGNRNQILRYYHTLHPFSRKHDENKSSIIISFQRYLDKIAYRSNICNFKLNQNFKFWPYILSF